MDEVRKLSYIEKIAILAGMNGMSYGEYVRTHDTSRLAEKRKDEGKHTCVKCGKNFDTFGHNKRRVCDECQEKSYKEYAKRQQEKRAMRKG